MTTENNNEMYELMKSLMASEVNVSISREISAAGAHTWVATLSVNDVRGKCTSEARSLTRIGAMTAAINMAKHIAGVSI